MTLAEVAVGRDNNFNLIRIVAAFMVLVSHSFVLSAGTKDAEPFADIIGMSFGSIAVDMFFVLSGFLVTGSLVGKGSIVDFAWGRIARIYPGLLVMVFLTALVLGPFITTKQLDAYFTDSWLWLYIIKCSSLVKGVSYNLPGVFEQNPYRYAVNGSLWSLPQEVKMYATLGLLYSASSFAPLSKRPKVFVLLTAVFLLAAGIIHVGGHFFAPSARGHANLFFAFFTGAAFYLAKERIVLSHKVFIFFVVMLLVCVANKSWFFIAYNLTLAYILMYCAYVPSGLVRGFNAVGDYSYGMYIYAFPVQQSLITFVDGIQPGELLCLSAVLTLTLAVASWHLIEKRGLPLRAKGMAWTKATTDFIYGCARSFRYDV